MVDGYVLYQRLLLPGWLVTGFRQVTNLLVILLTLSKSDKLIATLLLIVEHGCFLDILLSPFYLQKYLLIYAYLSKTFLKYAHIFGMTVLNAIFEEAILKCSHVLKCIFWRSNFKVYHVLKCIFWGSNFKVYSCSEMHFLREQLF